MSMRMRRGVLVIIMAFVLCSISYGQSKSEKLRFNVEVNQFITGSGFASGTEIYLKIDPDGKRSLAFGTFFDTEYKKITGISFHHELMVLRNAVLKSPIKPHIFYNLIYRKTTIPEVGPDLTPNGDLVTYTSMEHHIGMGINISLSQNIYLDCDLGYGAYLGSIKKPTAFNPVTGEIKGSNGLGMIIQLGIGYNIF